MCAVWPTNRQRRRRGKALSVLWRDKAPLAHVPTFNVEYERRDLSKRQGSDPTEKARQTIEAVLRPYRLRRIVQSRCLVYRRYRIIDYVADLYREKYTRKADGKVTVDKAESLRAHKDRGSAKKP